MSSAFLQGAASGAAAGSSAGPKGAIIGAIIGGGLGLYQSKQQESAMRKAERKRRIAIQNAASQEMGARQQANSSMMNSNIRNRASSSVAGLEMGTIGDMVGNNENNMPSSAGTF